jgi:hypothetical protein
MEYSLIEADAVSTTTRVGLSQSTLNRVALRSVL